MTYYCLLIFAFIASIVELTKPSVFKKLALCFVALGLFVFVASFRFQVGADWYSYKNIYEYIDSKNVFSYPIEPLFAYSVYFLKSIINNYSFFIFVFTTFAIFIKFKQFYKYSPFFFVSVMVYLSIQFTTYDLNGIRQGIAIGVVYLSIPYLINRKLVPFLLTILVASCFHASSIIVLPFYFISTKRLSPRLVNIILLSSIGVGILSQGLFRNLLVSRMGMGETYIAGKIISYSNDNSPYGSQLSFGFSVIRRLTILYLFMFFRRKIKISEDLYNLLFNAYFLSIITYFLLSSIEILAARGSLFYSSFDVFILASFVTIPKSWKFKLIIIVFVAFYSFWGIRENLIRPDNGLIPYKNQLVRYLL